MRSWYRREGIGWFSLWEEVEWWFEIRSPHPKSCASITGGQDMNWCFGCGGWGSEASPSPPQLVCDSLIGVGDLLRGL